MKLALAVALVAVAYGHLAPVISYVSDEKTIKDSYIIVFNKGAVEDYNSFKQWTQAPLAKNIGIQLDDRAWFRIGDFMGVSGTFSERQLELIRVQKGIQYIERDAEVHIVQDDSNPQQNPTWGIDRVDQRENSLDKLFYWNEGAGKGVTVFVIDTGIFLEHENFEGRATQPDESCFVVPRDSNCNTDCQGHGTHCAGTVGSRHYGVAREVELVGVRVLGCGGSGQWSWVINGIAYAAEQCAKRKSQFCVSNLSLGGGFNQAVNDAIDASHSQGVINVVAAGNNGGDACRLSPASADKAFTVGSTDSSNRLSSFSSRGECVDILAPGSSVESLRNARTGTRTLSGTSMAAPHVAGAVAAFLTSGDAPSDIDAVVEAVIDMATPDAISGLPSNTPNKLVFTNPKNRP